MVDITFETFMNWYQMEPEMSKSKIKLLVINIINYRVRDVVCSQQKGIEWMVVDFTS